jgi:flagellar biosynthesis/type III secretory pathway protein FliH
MSTVFAIFGAALSLAAFVAAGRMKGYSEGKADGQKIGYDEGFQAGHKKADDWWVNWECEVTKTRETIKHESGNGDEEGWP